MTSESWRPIDSETNRKRNCNARFSEQPPVNPVFETFGKTSRPQQASIEILPSPPLPRLWFLNEDESQLIQFQADRFVHNWRKTTGSAEYPRYEVIKERFLEEIQVVLDLLRKEKLGEIHLNQCEITYVNHIMSLQGEDLPSNLGLVLRLWNDMDLPVALGEMEDSNLRARFVITSETGEKVGRLSVSAVPGLIVDNTPAIVLTLTARGRPDNSSLEAASEFFDIGRERIVRTFTALTTDMMHKRWERKK